MKARARRARAILRHRRLWTLGRQPSKPDIIIRLRAAEHLPPVERLMSVRVIELELARRLFPDSL